MRHNYSPSRIPFPVLFILILLYAWWVGDLAEKYTLIRAKMESWGWVQVEEVAPVRPWEMNWENLSKETK